MADATPRKASAKRAPKPAPVVESEPKPAPRKASAPTVATPPMPSRPIEPGSRGEIVLAVQERLSALGLMDGKVNGLYGYSTVRAVRRLQGQNGIRPSGVINAATWHALYR